MSDIKALLEHADRAVADVPLPAGGLEAIERRRDRKHRNQRTRAGVLGIAIAIAVGWLGVNAIRSTPVPVDDPTPTQDLGMFAPAAGRIVYVNGDDYGPDDLGYGAGLWAVDPSGPSDTTEGPRIADAVASTLIRLGTEDVATEVGRLGPVDMIPLGWSSDGTELLLMRSTGGLLPKQYLSILHADGTETRLNEYPMGVSGATISPDGTRVVFAGQYDLSGLYVIDAEGGQPVPLPIRETLGSPSFSPDGTQIAYLPDNDNTQVWMADADGSNAHEILEIADSVSSGDGGALQWSPAGDRIAIQVRSNLSGDTTIYTVAPDGSDFTQVVTGAHSPYWSPDGSQIAYTLSCDARPNGCGSGRDTGGLVIADADGSNIREFGFAASGPWHPGGTGDTG